MKRVLVVLTALLLVGCTGADEQGNPGSIGYVEYTTPDGRVIPCLTYNTGYAGDISCDWNQR